MGTGVIVTVVWMIKPEATKAFIAKTEALFETIKLRPGFRNIRLLRGDIEKNQFILIEEWDEAQQFLDFVDTSTKQGDFEAYDAMVATSAQAGIWTMAALAGTAAE